MFCDLDAIVRSEDLPAGLLFIGEGRVAGLLDVLRPLPASFFMSSMTMPRISSLGAERVTLPSAERVSDGEGFHRLVLVEDRCGADASSASIFGGAIGLASPSLMSSPPGAERISSPLPGLAVPIWAKAGAAHIAAEQERDYNSISKFRHVEILPKVSKDRIR